MLTEVMGSVANDNKNANVLATSLHQKISLVRSQPNPTHEKAVIS